MSLISHFYLIILKALTSPHNSLGSSVSRRVASERDWLSFSDIRIKSGLTVSPKASWRTSGGAMIFSSPRRTRLSSVCPVDPSPNSSISTSRLVKLIPRKSASVSAAARIMVTWESTMSLLEGERLGPHVQVFPCLWSSPRHHKSADLDRLWAS